MASVNTVRGPVDSDRLGSTLMHEHVFVLSPEIEKTSAEWDEQAAQDTAVERLRELKANGIDTIVDLTVIGLGRFIPRIATVAERVPEINIVVATGVYTYNEVPMYFHFRGPGALLGGPEPMTELFVREIREGIGDSGVRAAILKCATDRLGITPGVERVLRAVAQAHRQTGMPITTHTPTPPRALGSRAAADPRRGGRRPLAGGDRPLRRHPRHQLPRGRSWPTGPTSASTTSASGRSPWPTGSSRCASSASAATPPGSCSPTTPCAMSTGSPPRSPERGRNGGGPTSPTTSCRPCGAPGSAEDDIRTMMVDNPRRILEGCEPY